MLCQSPWQQIVTDPPFRIGLLGIKDIVGLGYCSSVTLTAWLMVEYFRLPDARVEYWHLYCSPGPRVILATMKTTLWSVCGAFLTVTSFGVPSRNSLNWQPLHSPGAEQSISYAAPVLGSTRQVMVGAGRLWTALVVCSRKQTVEKESRPLTSWEAHWYQSVVLMEVTQASCAQVNSARPYSHPPSLFLPIRKLRAAACTAVSCLHQTSPKCK